jgi:dephospho-CoA kinase
VSRAPETSVSGALSISRRTNVGPVKVALTGGVGSGKSTAAGLLAEHGAVIIDADVISREVVQPGTEGLAAVVSRFGDVVLATDGSLDRPKLAAIVFSDDDERAALNAIVHPLVGARVAQLVEQTPPDAVLVYDVPLLAENKTDGGFDLVVVIEASLPTRLERLAGRGMAEQDARDRMAAQATDEDRRAIADVVVPNDGSLDDLRAAIDDVWGRIEAAR